MLPLPLLCHFADLEWCVVMIANLPCTLASRAIAVFLARADPSVVAETPLMTLGSIFAWCSTSGSSFAFLIAGRGGRGDCLSLHVSHEFGLLLRVLRLPLALTPAH